MAYSDVQQTEFNRATENLIEITWTYVNLQKEFPKLSETDGLKIPVCNNCHNMGQKLCRIHENPMAERLSKMLGQAIWEKEWISANNQQESRKAREAFRKRYGRSYL